MRQGNVYRVYPTEEQKKALENHFGAVRFVYNRFLHIRKEAYEKQRISVNRAYLDNLLSEKKGGYFKEMYPWLKEVNSQSLQQDML